MTSPISILLLGDSLTQGWIWSSTIYHPYAIQLKKRFEEAGKDVEITEKGLSGDRVVRNTILNRLQDAIKKQTTEGKKFDYVVILGGINDCGDGSSANDIFAALKNLYSICENHGAIVLALTIMEFIYENHLDGIEQLRKEVNELIRNYSKTNNKIILYDLAKNLPANSISEDERELYWGDSFHLTANGYDHMGDLIFEALYNQITKDV